MANLICKHCNIYPISWPTSDGTDPDGYCNQCWEDKRQDAWAEMLADVQRERSRQGWRNALEISRAKYSNFGDLPTW